MQPAEDPPQYDEAAPEYNDPEMDYPDPTSNDDYGSPTESADGDTYQEPEPTAPAGGAAAATATDFPSGEDRGRSKSVGQKVADGFKKSGQWIKGAGIRFGHKVKNEDWGGEIKRGGSATGKAVKDSFAGLGRGIKNLGNKEERSAMWNKTKNAWAKQWRLLKKSITKSVDTMKDKDKRKEMFEGMKRSTTSTFKAAGTQLKGYKDELAKTSKANVERAEGVPSTGTKVVRPPPSENEVFADAYEAPALTATATPVAAAAPADHSSPVAEAFEDNDYDATVGPEAEQKYTVMYNYDAGNEDELALVKGEVISATPADEIGWLLATNNQGVTGLIPANYVTEM